MFKFTHLQICNVFNDTMFKFTNIQIWQTEKQQQIGSRLAREKVVKVLTLPIRFPCKQKEQRTK